MGIKWDMEADSIIVGAGTGGLAAAIEARKLGDSVIVLEKEKDGVFRSSMSVIAGVLDFAGTKYQEEMGIEDSPALYAKDGVEYCGGDPALWKNMTDNLYLTLEMFENDLKLIPNTVIGGWGHSVARCHTFDGPKVIRRLEDCASELGTVIEFETPAKKLIYDSVIGVQGVVAEKNGELINVKAKKGLILATGGFGQNRDLCKEFGPDYLQEVIRLMPPSHTGDGLLMTLEIGGSTKDIKHSLKSSLPTCVHTLADTSIQYEGGICVNKEAKRFIREDTWYGYLTDAGGAQTDSTMYIIYDDDMRARTKKLYPTWLRHKEFKGDTIKDLAKELKLDAKELAATIDLYNKDAKAGKDTVCDRETLDGNLGKPIPLVKGPFYGMECKPSTTSFKGGVHIDPLARVIDWSGYVIPRLYAAGEVSGGFFGKGAYIWGTMTVMSMTMGMIASRDIHITKPL